VAGGHHHRRGRGALFRRGQGCFRRQHLSTVPAPHAGPRFNRSLQADYGELELLNADLFVSALLELDVFEGALRAEALLSASTTPCSSSAAA
jgi:hypothetical protein